MIHVSYKYYTPSYKYHAPSYKYHTPLYTIFLVQTTPLCKAMGKPASGRCQGKLLRFAFRRLRSRKLSPDSTAVAAP